VTPPRHGLGGNIDVKANKVTNGGIASSYAYADPASNLEDGLNVHPVARKPGSWLEYLLFSLVGRYGLCDNQQMLRSLYETLMAETYLPRKPSSMASDAMTEIELRFPTEISAECGNLPNLMAIPSPKESEYRDDETTGNTGAHHH